jgi:uncharacterized membrane protein
MTDKEPVTAYATAATSYDTPMHSQPKQGSRCCGCCCDYRRAVIIFNIFLVIVGILSVLGYTQGIEAMQAADMDSDEIEVTYMQQAILTSLGVFASIVAIVGAYRYNVYMVGFNVLYMIANFIATIVLTNKAYGDDAMPFPITTIAIEVAFLLLYIYPHVGFMSEVRAGILSAETYPREEFSCCCIQQRRY